MSEESAKKKLFDIATILTVGGIILYQMGWIYWTNYFSAFNIDPSFIEMPFEKFIATTWYISLIIIFGFLIGSLHVIEKEENLDIGSAIFCIVIAVISLLARFINDILFIILLVSTLSVFLIYIKISLEKNLTTKIIDRTKFFYILLVIMYILSFIIYSDRGENDAQKLIQNFKKPDIEIFCNDKSRAKGKFISFMNGKYFIIIKDKHGKNQTFILNDSEVHYVKFIK